jgi:hypothetical protein
MSTQKMLLELVQKRYTGDTAKYTDVITKAKAHKKPASKKETESEKQKMAQTEKEYKEALAYIKDLVSPAFMKIQSNHLKVNNTYIKTFFIYSYPSYLE